MESPFGSSLILIFFVVFAYLYLMIINRLTHNKDFLSAWKDGEVDIERHLEGYKQR